MSRSGVEYDKGLYRHELTRRELLKLGAVAGIGVALGGSVLAACGKDEEPAGGESPASDTLVMASWGGALQEATWEYLAGPFGEEKGILVQMVAASGYHLAQTQAQAEAGNVTWDILECQDGATMAALIEQDLLEPLPQDVKQRLEAPSLPNMVTDYAIMQSSIADVLTFDKSALGETPKNMQDWFDVERWSQPRTAYNFAWDPISHAWIALGLGATDVPTAEQEDEMFGLLETLKPRLVTLWDSADQSLQLMRSGEAQIGQLWNRIARDLVREDPERFGVSWDECFYTPAWNIVLKDAPHKDLAFEYLEYYATHAEAQGKWATDLSYGVASADAQQYIAADAVDWLPETHLDTLRMTNDTWWAENADRLMERFNNLMG